MQDIMRPTHHPFSHFGCGNLTTLASLNQTSIRNWFSQEYDPRGMHLVVYSDEPISVLENRVKTTFGSIGLSSHWQGPVRAEPSGPIVPPNVTGAWVYLDPVKDIRTMRIVWQIPAIFANWGNRMGHVVGRVISRIGEGSIFAKLKSEGLASSLDADNDNASADSAFFFLEVELTSTGLENIFRVLEIIFQGIGTLGKLTIPSYIVEQHNSLALLNYKWQTRRSDLAFTKEQVLKLRREQLSVFPNMSLFWEYSPVDVAEIFTTHLAPNNSIVYIQARNINVTYDKFEPIVSAPYTYVKFTDADATRLSQAHQSFQTDISYAAESFLIPKDIRLHHSVDTAVGNLSRWLPLPEKFDCDDVQTTFVSPDVEFGVPRIDSTNLMFSPGILMGSDPRKRVILYLWLSAVRETTKGMRELAAAGGYRYFCRFEERSDHLSISIGHGETPFPHISIRLTGYSSRNAVTKIMEDIYRALRFPLVTPSQLQVALDSLRLNYQNGRLAELYKQTGVYWTRWGTTGDYTCTAGKLLEAVDKLQANDSWHQIATDEIREVIHDVFVTGGQGFHEFSFLAGNVDEQDVRDIRRTRDFASLAPTLNYPDKIDFFRPSFIAKSETPVFLYGSVRDIPAGRAAVLLSVPVGNMSDPLANAFANTIEAVCAGQFFAALRTRDQLGYVVGSMLKELHGMLYMTFIVQTEKVGGTEALSKIQNWIEGWIVKGIGEMDEYIEIDGANSTRTPFEKHFDNIKRGVITEWSSKHASFEEKTIEQLRLVLTSRDNLALLDQNLDELKTLTRARFRALVNKYFATGKRDWRAVVLDGGEGDVSNSTILEGWSVVTREDLDVEDGIHLNEFEFNPGRFSREN